MTKINDLQGSIVAFITPFNEDKSIDYESLEDLINFHVESDTDAILVCGTTGETPTLKNSEYKELVKFVVDEVDGKIPVIAGTGTNSTAKTIKNCRVVKELGVDGLLIVGPYYNKPTPQGFYLHYSMIAKKVNLPIIIYNVPGRTGKNIPADVILKLAKEYKNIIGVKEASGDMKQITDIIQKRPKGFKVFSGDDALAFHVFALGGDGCISVAANEIPKEFHDMIMSGIKGDIVEARKLHFKYLNLMNLNFIETNPIPVKTTLSMMGKCKEEFRLPMCRMENGNKDVLRKECERLKLIDVN